MRLNNSANGNSKFDGSPESWGKLFNGTSNANPGGILAVFANEAPLDKFIAGWHIAALFATDKNDKRFYKSICHFIPEKNLNRNILDNIKKAIIHYSNELKIPEKTINKITNEIKAYKISSMETENVLKALEKIDSGSAVAISCAQIYRINIESDSEDYLDTWSGLRYRIRTKDQLLDFHIFNLLNELNKISIEKNLFIISFFEGYGFSDNKLPSALENMQNLAVVTLSSSTERIREQNILKQIASLENEEEIFSLIEKNIEEPIKKSILKSYALTKNKKVIEAWHIIAPHINDLGKFDQSTILAMSQTAFAAGKLNECVELLKVADEKGIFSLEDLNGSILLCEKLGLIEYEKKYKKTMFELYPSNKISLLYRYKEFFKIRDLDNAIKIAKKLGMEFEVEACQAFQNASFNCDDFFLYAQKSGQLQKAYLLAASEAEYRNKLDLGKDLAEKIDYDTRYYSDAIRIRARILGKKILSELNITTQDILELENLIKFVATHPDEIDARFEIESLLEDILEPAASETMLITIAMKIIESSHEKILSGICTVKNIRNEEDDELDIDDFKHVFKPFFEGLLSTFPSSGQIIGQGTIPHHLKGYLSPQLIHYINYMIQNKGSDIVEDDIKFFETLLHVVALMSKELKDPCSDYISIRLMIGSLAHAGFFQKARDLAETALIVLAITQPDFLSWRISQSWLCFADAFQRTGNSLAALRCFCFSLLCSKEVPLNKDLFFNSYRLIARIFRDFGLKDLSLQMLDLERKSRLKADPGNDHFLNEIDQIELSIKIAYMDGSSSPEMMIKLLEECSILLNRTQPSDVAPLLTCQANLIKRIKRIDVEIPKKLKGEFDQNYAKLNGLAKLVVDSNLNFQPSKDDLLNAIRKTSDANSFDDLVYQLAPLRYLAENAMRFSCEKADIDLFLLASAILSQPILTIQTNADVQNSHSINSSTITNSLIRSFKEISGDSIKAEETIKFVQNIGLPNKKSLLKLADVSFDILQKNIGADESVVIVVQDDWGSIVRLVINKTGHSGPEYISQKQWSRNHYGVWGKTFPSSYGEWEPNPGLHLNEKTTKDDVKKSMELLSFIDFELPKHLTIIPDSGLFGFPMSLMLYKDRHIGHSSEVTTAPSVNWLISSRTNQYNKTSKMGAWFGSTKVNDLSILFLKDRLEAPLKRYGFNIIENDLPVGLTNSDIAIIVAHGSLGITKLFSSVTDTIRNFSPIELSNSLEGSGCAVLLVCHSGRSDPKLKTSETMGLVTELFRANVRNVIAPTWPLHVNVAELWLPAFLENFLAGKTLGRSSNDASVKVREKFDHPCAWNAMQVYGDGSFSLK